MFPARRSFRPVRLRPRRRHHPRSRHRSPLHRLRRRLWRRLVLWPPRPAHGLECRRTTPTTLRLPAAALATVIVTTALAAGPAGAQAEQQHPPTYAPPVSAPVTDPFRPPTGPYGPGNRGLEYDTRAGDPVWASADGTVVFAGPVAGTLHVSLRHADGVRTSYSFVDAVDVVLGQQVSRGDQIALAGERLHFGARDGDTYFDPAALFAGTAGDVEVELLPFEIPPGSTPEAEAKALAQLAFDGGGFHIPGLDSALGWLYDRANSTVGYATQLNLSVRGLSLMADLGNRLLFHGPCSDGPPPSAPVAGQDRVAITVAGLGSSSTSGSIDELRTADLGYDHDRVVRFSYAGGRVARSRAAGDPLATPHAGADLATAVTATNTTLTGNLGLDAAEALLGTSTGIDPDAEALRQLSEHSDVVRELAVAGVPEGVPLVSIAARGDVAVAAPNTEVDGATNVTVPVSGRSAHRDLVASDAATEEMARALAGEPPACESWTDVVADVAVGHGISFAEDQIGATAMTQLP